MKYYKLIEDDGGYAYRGFIIGKIYPGNFKEEHFCTVEEYATDSKYWQEVSPSEYYAQEDKMPEYFAIKRIADNPLWEKYISWWKQEFNGSCYEGTDNGYYGFKSSKHDVYNAFIKSTIKEDCVELTLEQWSQIINKNMKEEMEDNKELVGYKAPFDLFNGEVKQGDIFKLYQTQYRAKHNDKFAGMFLPKEIVETWEPVYKDKPLTFGGYEVIFEKVTSGVRGVTYYINITSFSNNPVELTLEQWDKIVNKNKQEVMKGIIGYKLKEDCKQYRKAIEKLVDPMCLSNEIENLGAERNSLSIANLKQAGVLELWFKPVYKKKTLKFGGYDVTFKKVTSGVRISCNGETGTFSQLEAIYNYFKPNSTYFKFGSQEVKKVEYVDEAAWSLDEESTEPVSIKIGCTTGTWDEFVAIYNKAKSML